MKTKVTTNDTTLEAQVADYLNKQEAQKHVFSPAKAVNAYPKTFEENPLNLSLIKPTITLQRTDTQLVVRATSKAKSPINIVEILKPYTLQGYVLQRFLLNNEKGILIAQFSKADYHA